MSLCGRRREADDVVGLSIFGDNRFFEGRLADYPHYKFAIILLDDWSYHRYFLIRNDIYNLSAQTLLNLFKP